MQTGQHASDACPMVVNQSRRGELRQGQLVKRTRVPRLRYALKSNTRLEKHEARVQVMMGLTPAPCYNSAYVLSSPYSSKYRISKTNQFAERTSYDSRFLAHPRAVPDPLTCGTSQQDITLRRPCIHTPRRHASRGPHVLEDVPIRLFPEVVLEYSPLGDESGRSGWVSLE